METIIAAIISGIATIAAAWISNRDKRPKPSEPEVQQKQQGAQPKNKVSTPGIKSYTGWWIGVMSLLAIFVVYAGFFIHQDLPSQIGLFIIPVVVIILSLAVPTKPWTAAAFTFGVSTIAFLTEFAVNLAKGRSIALSSGDKWLPLLILLFSALYAALGAGICWWKRKK